MSSRNPDPDVRRIENMRARKQQRDRKVRKLALAAILKMRGIQA